MSNEMNDKMKSDADQAMAEIGDTWPPMLFRFYSNCLEQGFDKEQSIILASEIMRSLITGARLE